jgi:hypothetical protein
MALLRMGTGRPVRSIGGGVVPTARAVCAETTIGAQQIRAAERLRKTMFMEFLPRRRSPSSLLRLDRVHRAPVKPIRMEITKMDLIHRTTAFSLPFNGKVQAADQDAKALASSCSALA